MLLVLAIASAAPRAVAGGGGVITRDDGHDNDSNNNDDNNRPLFLHSGESTMQRGTMGGGRRNHRPLLSMSFESHTDLLTDESRTTVYRALIPGGGNRLSETAKFPSMQLDVLPAELMHGHPLDQAGPMDAAGTGAC